MKRSEADNTPELTLIVHSESERLLKLSQEITDEYNPLSPELIAERSEIYRGSGRLDDAELALSQSSGVGWSTIPEYVKLADAMTAAGRGEDSIKILQLGLELAPNIPPDRDDHNIDKGYRALMEAFAERGEVELAFKTIEHTENYPTESPYRSNMINSIIYRLVKCGFLDEAYIAIGKLKEDEKEYVYGFVARASARRGDFETVEKLDQQGLLNDVFRLASIYDQAEYYIEKGEKEAARTAIMKAVEIHTKHDFSDDWRFRLVRIAYEKLDDTDLAKELLSQLKDTRFDTMLLSDIIQIQLQNGQQEEAKVTLQQFEERINQVESTKQNLAAISNNRAQLSDFYFKLGMPNEAKLEIAKIISNMAKLDEFQKYQITDQLIKTDNIELRTFFLTKLKKPPQWIDEYLATTEIEAGNNEVGIKLLDEVIEAQFILKPDLTEEERLKEIRGRFSYSLERYYQLYIKAGVPEKAKSLLERHFKEIYSTRDEEIKYYYSNCMLRILESALSTGNLDIGRSAIDEIDSPFTKSHAYAKLAEYLIETGSFDSAIQALQTAEELARHESEYRSVNSEAFLEIANKYLLLEIALSKQGTKTQVS